LKQIEPPRTLSNMMMIRTRTFPLLCAQLTFLFCLSQIWARSDLRQIKKHESPNHQYMGCYKDKKEKSKRALPRWKGSGMSVEQCIETCAESGYEFAGLQWKGSCRCGNDGYDKYGVAINCDCYGENVGNGKNCVFRTSEDKEFITHLNVDLGDKNHLLQNPILLTAFESITKDYLNEQAVCDGNTEYYYSLKVSHNSRNDVESSARQMIESTATRKKGNSKGRCMGNGCPKPIRIVHSGSRLLSGVKKNGCSETLLERLQRYKPPCKQKHEVPETFKNLSTLDLESTLDTTQEWEDCTSKECSEQVSTITKIYTNLNMDFDKEKHECSWQGISCNHDLWIDGIIISGKGDYVSIPKEIGDLSHLKTLFLNNKKITGTIPTELGKLSKLKNFDISKNDLSGEIPSEFGNLDAMERMFISGNTITGMIPTELGNLSKLLSLDLSRNSLSGEIPTEFGNLKNMEYLSVQHNDLSGTVPTEICEIEALYTSGNDKLTKSC